VNILAAPPEELLRDIQVRCSRTRELNGMTESALSPFRGMSVVRETLLALKNLFLPAFCRKCGIRILSEENLYFCADCWSSIELVREPKCPRCGRPHPIRVGFKPAESFVCAECSSQKQWVERTYAAGLHTGILRDAIHLLKYQRKRLLSEPLARLLFDAVAAKLDFESYDLLVPVPLHRKRQKERGYNQSELIGMHLCRLQTKVRLAPVVKRVKETPNFTLLGASERQNLIQKAFQVVAEADVRRKRILLLDDVVTTGATANECARTLRRRGAARVDVISLAVAGRL
jgi:ComF family protein